MNELYDGLYTDTLTQELRDKYTFLRGDWKGYQKTYKLFKRAKSGWKLPYSAKDILPHVDKTKSYPLSKKFQLKTTLRDYQQEIVNEAYENGSGIIFSPPGSGKTVMAIGLIEKFQCRTLIIVPTLYLLRQWQDRLAQFSNYKVTQFGEGILDVSEVTIATFASGIKYKDKLQEFELLIVDEAHHVAADTYSLLVSELPIKHKYGLTATLKRKDNLEFIVTAYLGEKIVKNNKTPSLKPIIYIQHMPFYIHAKNYNSALTAVANNENILGIQAHILRVPGKRLGLALRIAHLENLAKLTTGAQIITGSTKDRTLTSDLVLATTVLDEGMDIDWLEVLHLLSPTNNIPKLEQRINRVTRFMEGKKTPAIVDYFYRGNTGNWNIKNQQKLRLVYYMKKKYKIIKGDIHDKLSKL